MEERDLKNNYIFALIKLVLFLLIFCFLVEIIKNFLQELQAVRGLSFSVFITSILATFAFYIFFLDLNNFYRSLQKFFFRSTFFSCLLPSLLIILSLSYFFLPRIFNFSVNKGVFIFSGTFALFSHLIYVSKVTRGSSFIPIVNYLFIFSIFFILNIILFGFYLRIIFNFELANVLLSGVQGGAGLIRDVFVCSFR